MSRFSIPHILSHLRKTPIFQTLSQTTRNLLIYATWLPAVICFKHSIGEFAPINGPSMYPFINEGWDRGLWRDVGWIDKSDGLFGRREGEEEDERKDGNAIYGGLIGKEIRKGKREYFGLKRGMVVSLLSPTRPEVHSIKRVIALPGDTVITKTPYPIPKVTVPPGHIWVEGDGRDHGKESLDSNYYGPVAVNLVEGRLTWVIWPMKNIRRVKWWEWRGKEGRVVEGGGEAGVI